MSQKWQWTCIKKRFEKAKTNKEKRFKELNANYKPGSPLFVQERDKITPEFNMEIEAARNEILSEFTDEYEKVVAKERAAVSVTGASVNNVLETLKLLENISINLDEYTELVKTLGNKFYWVDRCLERLALKNGIAKTGVQPSLAVKLATLEELAQNTRDFISEYDGEIKNFYVTSSDAYIFKMEEKFTGGYVGLHLDDREQAERMVSAALGRGDALERACVLSNMLRTAEPSLQTEILSLLAKSESPALSDPAMKLTNVQKAVDQFKKQESKRMEAADAAMQQISNAKSHLDMVGVIHDNLDNRHFVRAIEERIAKTNDKELEKSYKHMVELKQEETLVEAETKQ